MFARRKRKVKFNGIASERFVLYFWKCEFRFNDDDEDILEVLSKKVLKIQALPRQAP